MQKRTFLTDATPVSIDAPVAIIGLVVINATEKDCVVTADNGDTFPCPALVIATWSLPPTLRLRAALSAKPTNGKSCNVIVTDEATLNSTSQLATLATSGSSVPTLTGMITATGVIAAGTGFTVIKGAAGIYTINFNAPFANPPIVLVNTTQGGTVWACVANITTNSVQIQTGNDTGVLADRAFNFLAYSIA